jgi:hypothetical protein
MENECCAVEAGVHAGRMLGQGRATNPMLCVHLTMQEPHQRHQACAHSHSMVLPSVKRHTRRLGAGPAGKKIASAIKDISFATGRVSNWHASCEPGWADAVDSSKKN